MSETDQKNKSRFAQLCKQKLLENENVLERIVFFQKCIHFLHGAVNKQILLDLGSKRPKTVCDSPKSPPTLTFSCAISKSKIMGFFKEAGTVIGERYKIMVRYFLLPKLANCPSEMTFRQDGAPSHYANIIRKYLDYKLLNRCMEKKSLFLWPPRSLDFVICDFFLWGDIK